MDTARTVLPALGLIIGVLLGWSWGSATLPTPRTPMAAVPAVCPPSPAALEARGLALEVTLLREELEEGW